MSHSAIKQKADPAAASLKEIPFPALGAVKSRETKKVKRGKRVFSPTAPLLTLLTIASVLFIWYVIARLRIWPELFVPSPSSVWNAFVEVAVNGYRGQTLLRT